MSTATEQRTLKVETADVAAVPPGYKRTEVGLIPEDWEVCTLRELCKQIVDGTHFTPRYVSDGVPFYSVENVTADDFSNVKHISTKEHEALIRRCKPERGDILLTRIGSLGDTKLIDWDVEASIYVSLALLKPGRRADPSYVYRYTQSSQFVRDVESRSLVNAAPKKINMGDIGAVPVPTPSTIPEQRAIAEALSDADGSLGALEALIVKKRAIKQAAMQQLLTGKTRLPGFSGPWQTKRLGDLATMGSGGTPLSSVAAYYDGGIPWVSISDMTKGGKVLENTDRNLTALGYANSAAQMFPRGTVLYAMYASLGECSIAGAPVCTSQAILGIQPHDELDGGFLYYFLRFLKPKVKALGQQGTQANLNKGMVASFRLALPSVSEQTAIATVLSDMDAEIAALERRRDKARAIKQGMMQQLLTGRVRLVEPPTREARC